MDELGRETDLSAELPSRRANLPGRDPLRGLGRRPAVIRWLWRNWPGAVVRPGPDTDLTELEGDPTAQASVEFLRIRAEDDEAGGYWV